MLLEEQRNGLQKSVVWERKKNDLKTMETKCRLL